MKKSLKRKQTKKEGKNGSIYIRHWRLGFHKKRGKRDLTMLISSLA